MSNSILFMCFNEVDQVTVKVAPDWNTNPDATEIEQYVLDLNTAGDLSIAEQRAKLDLVVDKFFGVPTLRADAETLALLQSIQDGTYLETLANRLTLDVIIAAGQSNSVGLADFVEQSTPFGYDWNNTDETIDYPLAHPVGGISETASMWVKYADVHYKNTGRRCLIVQTSLGGTSMIYTGSDSNWGSTGTLRDRAVTRANEAIAAVKADPRFSLGNVYSVFLQGETDAMKIVEYPTITAETYRDALIGFGDYMIANIPELEKLHVIQIGLRGVGDKVGELQSEDTDWETIRYAQTLAVAASDNLEWGYVGSGALLADGLYRLNDGVHFGLNGLEFIADGTAQTIGNGAKLPHRKKFPVLKMTPYADATIGSKSTRTVTHTSHPATEDLFITVLCSRNSTVNETTSTCTVAGVSAKLIKEAEIIGDDEIMRFSVFQMPLADMPVNVAGTPTAITFGANLGQNVMHAVVYDMSEPMRMQGFNGGYGNNPNYSLHSPVDGCVLVASAAIGLDTLTDPVTITNTPTTEIMSLNGVGKRLTSTVGFVPINADQNISFTASLTGEVPEIMATLSVVVRPHLERELLL